MGAGYMVLLLVVFFAIDVGPFLEALGESTAHRSRSNSGKHAIL